MSDAFIARQPIFNREQKLAGYELLYRPTAVAVAAGDSDGTHMSSVMLVNTVLTIGLEQITGDTRAWVNFPRELLLEHDFELLDPRRFSIELVESVECDEDTVAACRRLRAAGFTLVLDDFVAGEEYGPLLELAHIVKLDVLNVPADQLSASMARLARYKLQFVAERVSDAASYAMCRKLGFHLFQGFHFSRPEIVRGRDLPAESLSIARLMNVVLDPRTHDRQLEEVFRADPGLSYKLLRIVNSAATGGKGIDSIGQALRMIGRAPLHRWLALLFASASPRKSDVERELVITAIERGRICELIAQHSGRESSAPSLFLTGVLSLFDGILGVTMTELLECVSVSPEVRAALLNEEGPYTPYLRLAASYAHGEWNNVIELGSMLGVLDELPQWYAEASQWARELITRN
jgi:c-di-GMP phosphodiesterase